MTDHILASEPAVLTGRTAVVFGGSGFIGSHVAAELVGAGASVLSVDLREPEDLIAGAAFRRGDITNPQDVADAITGADHVFAFGGSLGVSRSITDPITDLRTSCLAQLILLEAVRTLAPEASVVFAGSRLEYGHAVSLPVNEQHPVRGGSPYAINKAACSGYYQAYAQLHGLHATVLRLPNPYGMHQRGASRSSGYGILNLFVDTALDGGCIQLYGGGLQLRDFVHVTDVAKAALKASVMSEAAGEIFNIGSGDPHSLRAAAELVIGLCGSGTMDVTAPWPPDVASVETGDFYFDISKASELLGWTPRVALSEGLRGVVDAMEPGRAL